MAGVTTRWRVGIVLVTAVVGIRVGLRVLMTRDTREHGVICRIHVAVAARCPFPGMGPGIDGEPCVVKGCARPRGRGVASRASGREG